MSETMLQSILREAGDPAEREALREAWDRLLDLEPAEPSPRLAIGFDRAVRLSRSAASRPAGRVTRMFPAAAILVVGLVLGGLAMRAWVDDAGERTASSAPRAEVERLGRAVSLAFEARALAPRRLDAVEALSGLGGTPEVRRILTDVVNGDPNVDVRLRAIEALDSYAFESTTGRRLSEALRQTDSVLVRIRLMELFVDHEIDRARPHIEELARDPRVDPLVRETARWAAGRLREGRPS